MNAPMMNTPLSALEYYNLVRERLEHEDNLIVQRLTWLVGSQSFLFTAYAIVSNGLMSQPAQPACLHFGEQLQLLFQLIPIVAMLTCVLIYISILAAVTLIPLVDMIARSNRSASFVRSNSGAKATAVQTLARLPNA